jgi:hypothetical protein
MLAWLPHCADLKTGSPGDYPGRSRVASKMGAALLCEGMKAAAVLSFLLIDRFFANRKTHFPHIT